MIIRCGETKHPKILIVNSGKEFFRAQYNLLERLLFNVVFVLFDILVRNHIVFYVLV